MNRNIFPPSGARFRALAVAILVITLAAIFLPQYFLRPAPDQAAPDFNSYLTAAMTKYGITSGDIGTCDLCHINPAGAGPLNAYGTAFAGIATPSSSKSRPSPMVTPPTSPLLVR